MFRSQEQQTFHSLLSAHIRSPDAPLLLEGGTGLGKTRAYLAALSETARTVALVLPTHQLIDQLLASEDLQAVGMEVQAFRPARFFERREDYTAARAAAIAGRVMCCTAASVMIDQRLGGNYNGTTRRDYLLFDEADQLPGAAALQRDLEITANDLAAAGIRSSDVRDCLDCLRRDEGAEPELRAKAIMALEALDEPAWYQSVGFNDDGGITLFHRLPGRLLKRIANEGRSAFISATLSINGNFADFRRSMGIGETSKLSEIIEPERHGEIVVETPTGESVADVLERAEKPCLCVTPSFALANEIGREVTGAVVRQEGETAFEAASRVRPDGILVAAGAWAGLDTPIRWASIVVPRIPFERPTIIDDKVESSYLDSRNVAIRRMRQVVGRGLRSPDARCTIYILDDRYRQLGNFLPERFSQSWREGARIEVTLSKAERDKAYRRAVLKKHGVVCKACGMIPKVDMQIEVHHLDPISEGERNTTLDDLVPLCANCHRLAHSERPPIPLERLRAMHGDG